jgi:hypothetical protein
MKNIMLFEDYIALNEFVSHEQLLGVIDYAKRLFRALKMDFDVTGAHLEDRINDTRNGKEITVNELIGLLKRTVMQKGPMIQTLDIDTEGVIKDAVTDLNMPFVIKWDGKGLDFIPKTILRKKGFTSYGVPVYVR